MEQKPTVGRIVHYHVDESKKEQPYPAVITHVWGDECVNLAVLDDGSFPLSNTDKNPTSVELQRDPKRYKTEKEARAAKQVRSWSWPPRG